MSSNCYDTSPPFDTLYMDKVIYTRNKTISLARKWENFI